MLDLNVKGVFHLTRFLRPALAAAGTHEHPARVINIGSVDGIRVPQLETYSYSASKAAVHHMTKVLAARLAPDNITVNAIAPGPFESKMMAATLEAFGDVDPRADPAEAHRRARRHGRHRHLPVLPRRRRTSPARSSPSTAASSAPSEPRPSPARRPVSPR